MLRLLAAMIVLFPLSGCAPAVDGGRPPVAAPSTVLAGSSWLLVEFRSNDDATGTIAAPDPAQFTLRLERDGRAALKLGCNRGSGSWSATAEGGFTLGPLAMTRALCPPPALDQRLARDAGAIRSYVIEQDRLYLNLMMDGGSYVWRRDPDGA